MGNLSVPLYSECPELTDQYLFFFLIVQEESKSRTLILIAGFIHDISSFLDHHPGGRDLLIRSSGKEMTASFFGGVYTHSNAAHNVCMRITSLQRSTTNLIRGVVFFKFFLNIYI